MSHSQKQPSQIGATLRRAFAEFLTIPTIMIAGFLILAAITYTLDDARFAFLGPVRVLLRERVFRDGKATSELLGTIAGSLITVTSITFSLLLLAVQQSAAALTTQVYDQFLRRRLNQFYFGFFVGISLYTLLILATVTESYNPVLGASVAFLLTAVALYLVILLLYTTIDQMRPSVILKAIHDHVLHARARQLEFLARTRRSSRSSDPVQSAIRAEQPGFVVRIKPDALEAAADRLPGGAEIILRVAVGSAVVVEDTLAELKAGSASGLEGVSEAVRAAIEIENQRDLLHDPAYGIEQLTLIAWTSISTAKSNPSPALLAIHNLRALLACWSTEAENARTEKELPVVYADDVMGNLLDAFESLAVAASESMQHQTIAEILDVFSATLERLPDAQQARVEDLIARLLSGMGDHVLTAKLEAALARLTGALHSAGRAAAAAQVAAAREKLAASIGKLGSRASRVPGPA